MEEKRNQIIDITGKLLALKGINPDAGYPEVNTLAGDGSQRQFYRLQYEDDLSFVAIVPSGDQKQGEEEALSSWAIGTHLYNKGIPVPELLGFDPETGLILTEDLGDLRLHEYAVQATAKDRSNLYRIYREVVCLLVKMQVKGCRGFDESWCWQTPRYDRQLMLERESGYFLEALCHAFLQVRADYPVVQKEFEDIAAQAARAPSGFFLHRDFQSRNIMLKDGRVRFIDYQGGRFGPLGYDLASLLLDPYVGLTRDLQERLLDDYINEMQNYFHYDSVKFRLEYEYLALQRNLQILGAFAFLGHQRGKTFFLPYIRPALVSLQRMLSFGAGNRYPALASLVETCLDAVGKHHAFGKLQ